MLNFLSRRRNKLRLSARVTLGIVVSAVLLIIVPSATALEVEPSIEAESTVQLEKELKAIENEYQEVSKSYEARITALRARIEEYRGPRPWFQERWDRFVRISSERFERPEGFSDSTLVLRRDEIKTRNNDADNAWGVTARLERPLWGEWSGAVEFNYLHSQTWPAIQDPKGFFGDIRGYGGMASLIFRPNLIHFASPYIIGGLGGYWWHFHENPYLQDHAVEVTLDPSVAMKIGGGFDIWLTEQWGVNFEVSYFDTQIDKNAMDAGGKEWNIMGDSVIGNEQIQISVGSRYRF